MNVQQFVSSGNRFECTLEPPPPPGATVCILDASFNPPNLAHKKLADLCLSAFPNSYLLLVLATGNADKPAVDIESLQQRADMIGLMARNEWAIPGRVGVGLVTEPRFVDKADAIKAVLPENRLVFAMGFDTLVRLGMPQYYAPHSVDSVMQRFFAQTDILVLTREKDGITKVPEMGAAAEQAAALQRMPVFAPFAAQIHVREAQRDTYAVSSSAARRSVADLRHVTPHCVAEFVLAHNLYGLQSD